MRVIETNIEDTFMSGQHLDHMCIQGGRENLEKNVNPPFEKFLDTPLNLIFFMDREDGGVSNNLIQKTPNLK